MQSDKHSSPLGKNILHLSAGVKPHMTAKIRYYLES